MNPSTMSPENKTSPVQLPTPMVRKLRVITAHRGGTQGEFITPLINEAVNEEYRKVVAEMGREHEGDVEAGA